MRDDNEERELIADFPRWPYFPYLPVKNRLEKDGRGWPKLGCMFASLTDNGINEVRPIIYDFTIDTIPKKKEDIKILVEFNSLDDLLAAGWVAD